MTKYILNSGNAKRFPEKLKEYNEEIFREFINGKKQGSGKNGAVKVLFCLFAVERERWEIKYEIYKQNTIENALVEIEVTMATPDKFIKQCQSSDVILFSGGDDELLMYRLSKFNIPKIWKNKVVAVSSASSNYLVNSFWTCDWRMVMKGMGILPIKFISHYKSDYGKDDPRGLIDWQKSYEELENYGDKNLPIHALEEGDFVVFEK